MEGANHVNDYTLSGGGASDSASSIKVFVRGRPPDGDMGGNFKILGPSKIQISDPTGERGDHVFGYEKVFWQDSTQEQMYDSCCRPHVEHLLSGFNSCVFAYGQTGSGKTYSMFGEEGEDRGLIPRCVENIVQAVQAKNNGQSEVAMVVSFLEIYCDQIRDLGNAYLASEAGGDKLGELGNSKTSEIFERLKVSAKRERA